MPFFGEDIEELFTSGDEVIVVLKISGFHPSTQEKISFRDITILSLDRGKIIKQRGLSDLFSMYLKLGLIEMPQT